MKSNSELYDAVVKYFTKNPINVEMIKDQYRIRNKFKIVDDKTNEAYDLGIKNSELYFKKMEVG